MWRGANKETPIEVKGEKQRVVVGVKRSRHIIFERLSYLERSTLKFLSGTSTQFFPTDISSLPQKRENCYRFCHQTAILIMELMFWQ
jgi:hypothetical protein